MPVLRGADGPVRARLPPSQRLPPLNAGVEQLLVEGDIEVVGRLVEASNATLLVHVGTGEQQRRAVYKPVRGEKPLWDFPDGTLAGREVAAYLVSEAVGLGVVPPTVLRPSGPYGTGSVQLWVDPTDDPGSDLDAVAGAEPGAGVVDLVPLRGIPEGWLTVLTAESMTGEPVVLCHADSAGLRRLALFDAVTNNSDRKGGHVLRDADGNVKGVDHGLTFNEDDKLRTVLWGWAGEPLTDDERAVLSCLVGQLAPGAPLAEQLAEHLTRAEVRRTRQRVERLLAVGRLPEPGAGWPPVPWPAF